jgi:hypothetical protein
MDAGLATAAASTDRLAFAPDDFRSLVSNRPALALP